MDGKIRTLIVGSLISSRLKTKEQKFLIIFCLKSGDGSAIHPVYVEIRFRTQEAALLTDFLCFILHLKIISLWSPCVAFNVIELNSTYGGDAKKSRMLLQFSVHIPNLSYLHGPTVIQPQVAR
jgi:hypothetical protein